MARIAIIGGAGYVGLSYAAAFAELGHDVTGLDLDATKVFRLSQGHTPMFELGLEDLLKRGLESGRLQFTTEYSQAVPEAEFVFLCVGTPSAPDGSADMLYVRAAASSLAKYARGHTIVVNKSTMPCGSAHFVATLLERHRRRDATFSVVANPEFLREGSAVYDIFNPDRIVLGTDDSEAAEKVSALYKSLDAPVLLTDPASAEVIKYASNAFLATKISFINELAQVCEKLGADIDVVARGMGLDERIGGRFLRAGAGFGGSCFPKDVRALAAMARSAGVEIDILPAVLSINTRMRHLVVEKVMTRLGHLEGKTVGVLGLAFKPNTDDIRDAPALSVIEMLLARGVRVRATDPIAVNNVAKEFPNIEYLPDAYATATGCDAVILMTEWDEYRRLDLTRLANSMQGRVLIDARNVFEPGVVQAIGLEYEGIGRPSSSHVIDENIRTTEANYSELMPA